MRRQHYCSQLLAPIIILSFFVILYLTILFPRTGRRALQFSLWPQISTAPGVRVCGFIPFREKISPLMKTKILIGRFAHKTANTKPPSDKARLSAQEGRLLSAPQTVKGWDYGTQGPASRRPEPSVPSAPDIQSSPHTGPLILPEA